MILKSIYLTVFIFMQFGCIPSQNIQIKSPDNSSCIGTDCDQQTGDDEDQTFLHNDQYCTQVNFAWTPNSDISLSGYTIYWGTTSGSYTSFIDIGLPAPVNNDIHGSVMNHFEFGATYFFAARAYNQSLTSDYSEEVEWTCLNI